MNLKLPAKSRKALLKPCSSRAMMRNPIHRIYFRNYQRICFTIPYFVHIPDLRLVRLSQHFHQKTWSFEYFLGYDAVTVYYYTGIKIFTLLLQTTALSRVN